MEAFLFRYWCANAIKTHLIKEGRGFFFYMYIDGLVQDCSISSVLAMKILQSCTKSSMSVTCLQNDGL